MVSSCDPDILSCQRSRLKEKNEAYVCACVLQAPGLSTSPLNCPPRTLLAGSARGQLGLLRRMPHNVESPFSLLTCAVSLSLSVCLFAAAFLGDIALDEEDLRSFRVDRIIDLAQRTVQTVNHTDTGNNVAGKRQSISGLSCA